MKFINFSCELKQRPHTALTQKNKIIIQFGQKLEHTNQDDIQQKHTSKKIYFILLIKNNYCRLNILIRDLK